MLLRASDILWPYVTFTSLAQLRFRRDFHSTRPLTSLILLIFIIAMKNFDEFQQDWKRRAKG